MDRALTTGISESIAPTRGEDAMSAESRQAHWEKVYTSKGENEVSWFQEKPAPSSI